MKSFNKYLLHPFDSSTCMKTTEPLGWGGSGPRPEQAEAARAPAGCPGLGAAGCWCYDRGTPTSLGSLSQGADTMLGPAGFLVGMQEVMSERSLLHDSCPAAGHHWEKPAFLLPSLPSGIYTRSDPQILLPAFSASPRTDNVPVPSLDSPQEAHICLLLGSPNWAQHFRSVLTSARLYRQILRNHQTTLLKAMKNTENSLSSLTTIHLF